MALTLIKKAETSSTITLGWTPPEGIEWYLFFANGKRVANGSPTYESGNRKGQLRDEVKFSKPGEPYQVVALILKNGVFSLDVGTYVAAPDPDPPPAGGFGDLLRQRFPAITPTTTVDDTGKPERTSTVIYDGSSHQRILLKNVRRRGGKDGFKIAGGANSIELRLCSGFDLNAEDDSQGISLQRAPRNVQVYGGEFGNIGQPGSTLAHFIYMGNGAEDILTAGVLAHDFSGYGLHAYPGPGSGVSTNCTIVRSGTRTGAVVYTGFNLYIVNSIIAYNALAGITDRGGTWKVENCCVWPRPSNYTDGRFVNCIFEDPQLDAAYRPQNPKLADGGLAGWMAPHDYKGSPYTRRSIGAVAL